MIPIDVTAPVTLASWDGESLSLSMTDNRSGVMGTTLTINGFVIPHLSQQKNWRKF